MEPVKVNYDRKLTGAITVRFDPKTLVALRKQANKKGLGPTQLIRMWVMEQLGKQYSQQASKSHT
jgi:predicted DNA binding CopG/RHH family protein